MSRKFVHHDGAKKGGQRRCPQERAVQRPRLRVSEVVLKRGELLCQKRDEGEHEATRDTCLFTVRGGGREEGRKEKGACKTLCLIHERDQRVGRFFPRRKKYTQTGDLSQFESDVELLCYLSIRAMWQLCGAASDLLLSLHRNGRAHAAGRPSDCVSNCEGGKGTETHISWDAGTLHLWHDKGEKAGSGPRWLCWVSF